MAEMSPLLRMIVGIVRAMTLLVAGMIVLIMIGVLWHGYASEGFALTTGDWRLLGLLALLVALAAWIYRGLGREMDPPES